MGKGCGKNVGAAKAAAAGLVLGQGFLESIQLFPAKRAAGASLVREGFVEAKQHSGKGQSPPNAARINANCNCRRNRGGKHHQSKDHRKHIHTLNMGEFALQFKEACRHG